VKSGLLMIVPIYAKVSIKTNGSITAWGSSDAGGTGAPSGTGYTKIYSSGGAFAAVKADGTKAFPVE
jgi:hypothetical protein